MRAIGLVLAILISSVIPAFAEDSTRVGLSMVGGTAAAPEENAGIIGTQVSVAHWVGRFGVAAEGSAVAFTSTMREGGATAGLGARMRLLEGATSFTALNGTRAPIALGLELECVAQHEWWDFEEANESHASYALGLAASARGSDRARLVGFRASIRFVTSSQDGAQAVARMLEPPMDVRRSIGVLVSFGTELGVVR
jgi:hypothetical protein